MTKFWERHSSRCGDTRISMDGKLAAYLAATGAVGSWLASDAEAVIVSNNTSQIVGVNGAAGIDFNGDGQLDFEIDHDQVDLGGGNLVNYLQLDKNDATSASNPLAIPGIFDTFDPAGNPVNNPFDAKYVTPTATQGDYPAALNKGAYVGLGANLDFQEGDGFGPNTNIIRANRLIDGDQGLVDNVLGGTAPADISIPTNGPNFLGLGGEVRYLGVQMNMQSLGQTYGWIGVRITDDSLGTAEVVGWAYETSGGSIRAGEVPEPTTFLAALVGGSMLFGCLLWRRVFGR